MFFAVYHTISCAHSVAICNAAHRLKCLMIINDKFLMIILILTLFIFSVFNSMFVLTCLGQIFCLGDKNCVSKIIQTT